MPGPTRHRRPRGRRPLLRRSGHRPCAPGHRRTLMGPDRLVLRPAGAGAAAAGPSVTKGAAFQRRRRAVLAPSRRYAAGGSRSLDGWLHAGAHPPHQIIVRAECGRCAHRPAGRARGLGVEFVLGYRPDRADDPAPGVKRPVLAAAVVSTPSFSQASCRHCQPAQPKPTIIGAPQSWRCATTWRRCCAWRYRTGSITARSIRSARAGAKFTRQPAQTATAWRSDLQQRLCSTPLSPAASSCAAAGA